MGPEDSPAAVHALEVLEKILLSITTDVINCETAA
jgi:hypothetical protein